MVIVDAGVASTGVNPGLKKGDEYDEEGFYVN
jgi:hypothetical protein